MLTVVLTVMFLVILLRSVSGAIAGCIIHRFRKGFAEGRSFASWYPKRKFYEVLLALFLRKVGRAYA